MNKIAFIFPGQGSQYPEMGKDFFVNSRRIRDLYAKAENVLNMNLSEKIFSGDDESLKDTSISQLAIFITSFSCYQMLIETDIRPEMMAGHSLGEYSALTCAGALSFPDSLKLVQKRSQWMAESSQRHPGKMAAIIGLPAEKVEEICREIKSKGVISIANFNSPLQTVISGESVAIDEGVKLAQAKGAKRVVMLKVSGSFHTELMKGVGEKLKGLLDSVSLTAPQVPVVSNVNAETEITPEEIRENLIKQVSCPVQWTNSINNLIDWGFDTFVEVGPRRILSGLLIQFNRKVNILNVEDLSSLEMAKKALMPTKI